MDRTIVQYGAIPLDTDLLLTNRRAMVAIGAALQAAFGTGNIGAYVSGLPCTPGTGLTVNIGPGSVYIQAAVDATPYGSLPANTADLIIQQGNLFGQNPLACPAPPTAGQSINYLVEVQYQQVDDTPTALLYYNSANPLQPLVGAATNARRSGVCALRAKAGTAAATGTQTTPAADAGWTGLYVVTVANGATSIITGNIAAVAGAPVLAGLLSSHHGGGAGQAPKINLTTEVQGVLPSANLPIGITIWCGTSTGSANAQVVATPTAMTSFPTGTGLAFVAGFTNGGAATLTVGGFGTFAFRKDGPTGPIPLAGGEIVVGGVYTVRNDGTFVQLTSTELGTAALANASSNTGTVVAASGSFTVGHLMVASDTAGTAQDGGPVGAAGSAMYLTHANNGQVLGVGSYAPDTSTAAGGAFSNKLPATPFDGEILTFYDSLLVWHINNYTVDGNGKTITALAQTDTTLTCNTRGLLFQLQWNATLNTWEMS